MVAERGKSEVFLIDAFGPIIDISGIQPFDKIQDTHVRFWHAEKLAEGLNELRTDTDESKWDKDSVYEKFVTTLRDDSVWAAAVSADLIDKLRKLIEVGVEIIVFTTAGEDVFELVSLRLQQDLPALKFENTSAEDLMKTYGVQWAKEKRPVSIVDDIPFEDYILKTDRPIKHYYQTQPESGEYAEYSKKGIEVTVVPVNDLEKHLHIHLHPLVYPASQEEGKHRYLLLKIMAPLLAALIAALSFIFYTEDSGYIIGQVKRPPGTSYKCVVVVRMDGSKDSEVRAEFRRGQETQTYRFSNVPRGPHEITFIANGYETDPIRHNLKYFCRRYWNMEVEWPKDKQWVAIDLASPNK